MENDISMNTSFSKSGKNKSQKPKNNFSNKFVSLIIKMNLFIFSLTMKNYEMKF